MERDHLFAEGDIVYTIGTNGQYILSKILKIEKWEEGEVWHELIYSPVNTLPRISEVKDLVVSIYHVPRARPEELPTYLGNLSLTEDDMEGYNEYLKQIQS